MKKALPWSDPAWEDDDMVPEPGTDNVPPQSNTVMSDTEDTKDNEETSVEKLSNDFTHILEAQNMTTNEDADESLQSNDNPENINMSSQVTPKPGTPAKKPPIGVYDVKKVCGKWSQHHYPPFRSLEETSSDTRYMMDQYQMSQQHYYLTNYMDREPRSVGFHCNRTTSADYSPRKYHSNSTQRPHSNNNNNVPLQEEAEKDYAKFQKMNRRDISDQSGGRNNNPAANIANNNVIMDNTYTLNEDSHLRTRSPRNNVGNRFNADHHRGAHSNSYRNAYGNRSNRSSPRTSLGFMSSNPVYGEANSSQSITFYPSKFNRNSDSDYYSFSSNSHNSSSNRSSNNPYSSNNSTNYDNNSFGSYYSNDSGCNTSNYPNKRRSNTNRRHRY